MKAREEIIVLLKRNLPYLTAEFGIKRIGLFGSYAKGSAEATSDVDLVVEFHQPIGLKFVELAEFLEALLGKKVDLLTPDGIRGIRIPSIANDIVKNIVYV
ncbi:MAG: nucleotidyltransferase [Bacteroidetes bacterium]|nr:MAG: nucleotidyltransferase [Bacteroidota bacterium]